MANPSDEDLARRAQRGDLDAYSILAERCQGPVFAVCYRLLGDRWAAEDLAQEALLRAYQRLGQYQLERPFLPWIRRLAANLCLNHLEKQRHGLVAWEDEWLRPLAQASAGVEALQEQVETGERIRRALLALPPRYRVVVELRHFQEMAYNEIALELGWPLSDVKSYLFRARRLLAEALSNHEP